MFLALTAAEKILVMMIIAIVGCIAYKTGIITEKSNKSLTSVLLMAVNPIMIINAYQTEVNERLMHNFIISAVLAVASHLIGIALSFLLVGAKRPDYETERLSVVYSNCGFIGIPLVNGLFGMEGVLYLTAYMTVFNICLWTHGVIQTVGRTDMRTTLRHLASPAIVCSILGLLLFVFKIKLPAPAAEAVEQISAMNSPLAMIIAGATIAQTDIRKALTAVRVYYISALRLFAVPLVCVLAFMSFGIEEKVVITAIVEAACPAAASATMFAINYGKNAVYASEIFAVSTILSFVSLPAVIMLAELACGF